MILRLHHLPPRLLACLLSRSRAMPSGLSSSHACQPLKLQSLSPTGCKSTKISSSCFSSQWLWGSFLGHISVHPTLSGLSAIRARSPPQYPQSMSPPSHISALPTFLSVASSLPLVMEFVLSILRLISWIFRMI